jgi:hypothetical protein
MYRRTPEDAIIGVLNDFDLAKQADETSPSSSEITGTTSCMAVELLKTRTASVPHLYRHDLESLGWAFLLIASEEVNDVGGINPHPALREWYTGDRTFCAGQKLFLLSVLEERVQEGTLPLAARNQRDEAVTKALTSVLRWIRATNPLLREPEVPADESYKAFMAALGFRVE